MPQCKCRADRATGIACGGLHIHALERRHAPYLTVRNRIHGAAACKGDIRQLIVLLQFTKEVKERFFTHCLNRPGDMTISFIEWTVRQTPGSKEGFEFRREKIIKLR